MTTHIDPEMAQFQADLLESVRDMKAGRAGFRLGVLHQLIRSRVHIIACHFRWQTPLTDVKTPKGQIK